MLLHKLHRIALWLLPFRMVFLLLALLALLGGLYAAITDNAVYSVQLRLFLIFSLWALMLFAFIQLFRRIPPPVLPGLGFFERLRDRLRLLLYQGLALFVAALTLFLVAMSLKLLFVQV